MTGQGKTQRHLKEDTPLIHRYSYCGKAVSLREYVPANCRKSLRVGGFMPPHRLSEGNTGVLRVVK